MEKSRKMIFLKEWSPCKYDVRHIPRRPEKQKQTDASGRKRKALEDELASLKKEEGGS